MAVLVQATELYARVGMLQFDDVWRAAADATEWEVLSPEGMDALRSLTLHARRILTHQEKTEGIRSGRVPDTFRVAWDIYQVARKAYYEFRCRKEPGLRQKLRATVYLDQPMRSSTYEPLLPLAEARVTGR
ncbi:MAG: hypothetical protein MUP21_05985 [Dehalococcoidia bacterium]|nr:hypothetical protein [Dehalococcoidia bacterium]